MKKQIYFLALSVLLILNSCSPTVKVTDKDAVLDYLCSKNDFSNETNGLTTLLMFNKGFMHMSSLYNGSRIADNEYSYEVGNASSSEYECILNIHGGQGKWSITKDGDVFLSLDGKLTLFHPDNASK